MKEREKTEEGSMGLPGIILHLGIMTLGIAGWLTGDGADDYKKIEHAGFTLHSWIGMGLASVFFLRLVLGILGPSSMRFSRWIPFTGQRIRLVMEDIAGLFRLKLPDRRSHEGLAGAVQTFGLAIFLVMAVTGGLMFFLLEPGQRAHGFAHDLKEFHEAGELLIPLFLALHAGAVILHTLSGKPVWKRMLIPRTERGLS